MSLDDLLPASLPRRRTLSLPAGLARFAAWCWWSLRVHVAERHHLPRDAAGPPPFSRLVRLGSVN
jgi:hypothetical protein